MTVINDLMGTIEYKVIQGSMDTEISSIAYDSRKCIQDSLFVCIVGQNYDGHDYISQAIANGASAIFVQELVWEIKGFDLGNCENKLLTVVVIKDSRSVLTQISSAFFKNPSRRLKLLGITGTKGKTTSAFMFHEIFKKAGKKAGLIGTVACYAGGEKISHAPLLQNLQWIRNIPSRICKHNKKRTFAESVRHKTKPERQIRHHQHHNKNMHRS